MRLRAIFLMFVALVSVFAHSQSKSKADSELLNEMGHSVLLISSYIPDVSQASNLIGDFISEFNRLGYGKNITIESLNCKSFSESTQWTDRMINILGKYHGEREPMAVVLLGQEAWAAYLSMPDRNKPKVPVLAALGSENVLLLPPADTELSTWMPRLFNFSKDLQNKNINVCAGFLYQYKVEETVRMITELYPQTEHIAFISDNSYDGVALQTYVRRVFWDEFPRLNLILLDGRRHNIYGMCDRLRELPKNTVILVGTWKMDTDDGYYMGDVTRVMRDAVPTIPAFTLTSTGLGYWAVGGTMPVYHKIGAELARKTVALLERPYSSRDLTEYIDSRTVIDVSMAQKYGADLSLLTMPYTTLDDEPSFFEQHIKEIVIVAVMLFLFGLAAVYGYRRHMKRIASMRRMIERAKNMSKRASSFDRLTPENIMRFYAQSVANDEIEDTDRRSLFVNMVMGHSQGALRHMGDVIDFARLKYDIMKFDVGLFDAVFKCRTMIEEANRRSQNGNSYTIESSENAISISTDLDRFERIIKFLLDNSENFTNNGVVSLSIERLGPQVQFTVSDTGVGMPVAKCRELSDPEYFDFDDVAGVELQICRIMVEKMGGHFWFDQAYKHGSSIVLTLPTYQGLI